MRSADLRASGSREGRPWSLADLTPNEIEPPALATILQVDVTHIGYIRAMRLAGAFCVLAKAAHAHPPELATPTAARFALRFLYEQ